MLTNFVACKCGKLMRLETAAPGNVDNTLILTYHCKDCDKRRRFIFTEIVIEERAGTK